MSHTISFDVTVERHEPSGAFVARSADFPGKVGIGTTEGEAVADLRAHVLRPTPAVIRPHPPGTDPWAILPGLYPDDELTQEWEKIVRERRDLFDELEAERG